MEEWTIVKERKISVIIPAYNSEETIARALDSVISQNYSNLEIIVIDDGSTDSTYDISVRYSKLDNRIKVITQSNSGLGATRNRGISFAQGEIIALLDSDDAYIKGSLLRVNDAFGKYDADIVASDFLIVDEQGGHHSSSSLSVGKFPNGSVIKHNKGKESYCKRIINTFCPTYFYKKKYLNENNIRFPEPGRMLEDIVFFGRLLSENPTIFCLEGGPTYLYYMGRDSLAHAQNSVKAKQAFESIMSATKYFNKTKEEKKFILEQLLFAYYISAGDCGDGDKDNIRDTISKYISKYTLQSVMLLSCTDKIKWILIKLNLHWLMDKLYSRGR